MRLISETGEQVGIMPLKEALWRARKQGLDLVEVAPIAKPPVCRLLEYGKFRYKQAKKERKSSKSQRTAELKEVRLRPRIGQHDIEYKTHSIRKFLEEGNKVKITVAFRGRERNHPELGKEVLDKVVESVGDQVKVERSTTMKGNNMDAVLALAKQGKRGTYAQDKNE